jgi:ubiquinone/menaquinone biosynthesis C-methylase UbiE
LWHISSNPGKSVSPADRDSAFSGSIPEVYERYLVPPIFDPYAADLANRAMLLNPTRVLEVAAGTGVLTRALANALPSSTGIVATDLNQPMLDQAALVGTARSVEWRQADVFRLPFPDDAFDMVACQFGVMFFPEHAKAYAEIRRVLRSGGKFLFNVWDRLDQNEFAETVTRALAELFPQDPPRFMDRVPHGYYDYSTIQHDLVEGGFSKPADISTVTARSSAGSARIAAMAHCMGTPLRNEIESRDATRLDEATACAAEAIERRFGSGVVTGKIQAHVICVERQE